MYITHDEKELLVRELLAETHGHIDGSGKNILVPECPACGKGGSKFGIYIGPETKTKELFMSHCFKCGHTTKGLSNLLDLLGRSDLMISEKASFAPLDVPDFYKLEDDEIDDELSIIEMPEGWKRCFRNQYLRERGFTADDYLYFPVGTTRGLNFRYNDYVIFPIVDSGDTVGFVSRHIWSKAALDEYNIKAKRRGKYEIRRYSNSTENDFVKLLYNYDAVHIDETDTVILCEGIFDVIALTRKLELYDNRRIVPVATFGKKISLTQIYKLQSKGVRTIVIGYDNDARDGIIRASNMLSEYFDVYIASLDGDGKDFDEADFWSIYDAFTINLKTPNEYKMQTI